MNQAFLLQSVLGILVSMMLSLAIDCSCALAQVSPDGQGELMLLKNGSVLQGFVERTANHYSIQTRPGNRLIIPFEKVELVGHSLAELYWRRLATIGATDIEAQQELFQWCLKHSLWNEAANQVEVLQALQVDAAMLQQLQRRLDRARQSFDEKQTRTLVRETANESAMTNPTAHSGIAENGRRKADLADNGPSTNRVESASADSSWVPLANNDSFFSNFEPVFEPLPSIADQFEPHPRSSDGLNPEPTLIAETPPDRIESEGVVQVGFDDEDDRESNPATTEDLSVRELEQFVKGLPKNSLARFRSRVEPVLIANCSDCHNRDGGETPMRLLFRNKRTPITVRMSQRNLYAAWRQIDTTNLEASALLSAAATAHGSALGGGPSTALSKDSPQFLALQDWVQHVTQVADHAPVAEDPRQSTGKNGQEGPGSSEPRRLQQPLVAAALSDGKTNNGPQPILPTDSRTRPMDIQHAPTLNPIPPTIGEIPLLTRQVDHFVPRDEFDPEIFNRQFQQSERTTGTDR